MKLSSARFDGYDRRHRNTIAKQFCNQFNGNRLGLDNFNAILLEDHEDHYQFIIPAIQLLCVLLMHWLEIMLALVAQQ